MALTPESKVKLTVKQRLKELLAYWHCPVQNGMGSPALDFHVCLPIVITQDMVGQTIGIYVGIETKKPGGKPTPRQEGTIAAIERAHGIALLIDGDLTSLTDTKLGVRHDRVRDAKGEAAPGDADAPVGRRGSDESGGV